LQLQVNETQVLIEKQRQMIAEAEEAVKVARASADITVGASKEKMAAIQYKELEIVAVRRRIGAITNLFSLQREAQAISAGLARTRESILPSPLVISGPSGAGIATFPPFGLRFILNSPCHTTAQDLSLLDLRSILS
jgi:hypothetical protein